MVSSYPVMVSSNPNPIVALAREIKLRHKVVKIADAFDESMELVVCLL